MDENQRLLYLTTKQFNLTEEEAKALLFDGDELRENAADIILERDKERVQKLKDERTARYNEGFQTAEKKYKSHAEETFKRLTGYNGGEDNFEAMFQTWYAEEKKKAGAKKEITEDDIKRHPLFVKLETETIPKAKYEELERSFTEFKTAQQRAEVMGVVTSKAWDLVAAKEPILEENEVVAANRRRDFLAKFSGYEYDLQDSKIIVLKDGKRLEDEHGNLLPFEAFVMQRAQENFIFRAQDDKGNAGNKKGSGESVIITEKPTTAEEYARALDKYNGASEEHTRMRVALKKYYYDHKKD